MPNPDDKQARNTRVWIASVSDVLSAAQTIAGRAADQFDGTGAAVRFSDLCIAIGRFRDSAPEMTAVRVIGTPK